MTDIAGNWRRVCERVAAAAGRAGRAADAVTVVAVSKGQPAAAVAAVLAAGATDIGENYVQEAAAKIAVVGRAQARWHLVGHLQRNKAARAAELFDVVQTLDSVALGRTLARHAAARGRVLPVFAEVNIGGEPTKAGARPDEVAALLEALGEEAALRIDGLMAIPPPCAEPAAARPFFRALGALRDTLRAAAPPNAPLRHLSMGMSDDFEVAIEEGATLVRIGRAIFGARGGGGGQAFVAVGEKVNKGGE